MDQDIPDLVDVSVDPKPAPEPVGVIVLTGLLGSGKTTLLQKILSGDHGKRIAVIMNELGDTEEIDRTISENLRSGAAIKFDDWIELRNGCICCSVKDAGTVALEKLVTDRKDSIDYVLVETTGMADPANFVSMFWLDEELESRIKLCGVVTVVDCKNLMQMWKNNKPQPGMKEAELQIALADRIVLNKIDLLAGESDIGFLETKIAEINTLALTEAVSYADIDLEFVLGARAYDLDAYSSSIHEHKSTSHEETHNVSAITLDLADSGVSRAKLEKWLQQILWEPDQFSILRVKGIFLNSDDGAYAAVQAVKELYEFSVLNKVPKVIKPRIVFIGYNILRKKEEFQMQLNKALS